jgi:hypothetical protein
MALTDHGNFNFAIEVTEELLGAALVAGIQLPPAATQTFNTPLLNVRLDSMQATLAQADCRAGAAATVALTGSLVATGNLQAVNLPFGPPVAQDVTIHATFQVITTPRIGTVAGTRGLVVPVGTAVVDVTLVAPEVTDTLPVQAHLIAAFVQGGEAAYQQLRTQILDAVRGLFAASVQGAVRQVGDVLALPEPPLVRFDAVLTTNATLKLLLTQTTPPGGPLGNAALVSGMTVRRNSLGGPLDHAALVASNAHVLGNLIFPAVTGALGIGGIASRAGHPCLLIGPIALPGATFGIPTLPGGAPAATVFLDFLLGQIDGSGISLGIVLRAVSFGSFATVTMRGSVTAAVTASVTRDTTTSPVTGTLSIGPGVPAVTTSTDIAIDPSVYVVAALTGGLVLTAVVAATDLFGGGFIDGFISGTLVPRIPALPPFTLPLAGPFANLNVTLTRTLEPAPPPRSVTIGGVMIPIDRVNDVSVFLA